MPDFGTKVQIYYLVMIIQPQDSRTPTLQDASAPLSCGWGCEKVQQQISLTLTGQRSILSTVEIHIEMLPKLNPIWGSYSK